MSPKWTTKLHIDDPTSAARWHQQAKLKLSLAGAGKLAGVREWRKLWLSQCSAWKGGGSFRGDAASSAAWSVATPQLKNPTCITSFPLSSLSRHLDSFPRTRPASSLPDRVALRGGHSHIAIINCLPVMSAPAETVSSPPSNTPLHAATLLVVAGLIRSSTSEQTQRAGIPHDSSAFGDG